MKLEELANKKILIVGVGLEGEATARFLKRFVPTAHVSAVDKKNGVQYLAKQHEYDLAIKSPGVRSDLITIPYTTATNIFFANANGITVGITGTKGKSTTSSLIFDILKAAGLRVHLGGNIGRPLLDELLTQNSPDEIYVSELSSYQLADIKYSPHISVILNLFPEHMDYHRSIKNYFISKKRIVSYATEDDYFVYNPDYPELVQLAKQTIARSLPFVTTLPVVDSEIPLLGVHNKDNVRAAVTVGTIFHVSAKIMQQAIKNFHPLPHRLQNIGTFKGITFYDDAISTTPQSTLFAINAINNIGTIIVGGQDRGYDFRMLVDGIIAHHIDNVIYFPDSGKTIADGLRRQGFKRLHAAQSMEEAVHLSFQVTQKGKVCLLSCASPSYSLWKNFEEKGDQFQSYVKKISSD